MIKIISLLILSVVLGICLAYWWSIQPGVSKDLVKAAVSTDPIMAHDRLLDTPIFGQGMKTEHLSDDNIKKSVLKLTLLGSIVAGSRSVAIIQSGVTGKQKAYMKDDVIQYGVSVHSITEEYVIVDNQGKLEKLLLHSTPRLRLKPVHSMSGEKPAVKVAAFSKKQRTLSNSFIQEQTSDISKLLSEALVSAHYTQGKQDGFMINNIVNGSFYQKIGLRDGDVLRKVNGTTLTSAAQGMLLYRELKSASAIDLEIMRGNQIIPVRYELRK